MPRLFFSLPIPDEIRARLVAVQEEFRRLDVRQELRFVRPELMHMTILFLGEVEVSDIDRLRVIGREVGELLPPFLVGCRWVESFPKRGRRLGVLYAGMYNASALDYELYSRLDRPHRPNQEDITMMNEGISHVTLARGKGKVFREPFEAPMGDQKFGRWTVDSFQLVESRLGQEPRYVVLEEFPLQAKGWESYQARHPEVFPLYQDPDVLNGGW